MNCLILAAGLGSRLRGLSESKPLTPIAGTPLIEHVLRRAAAGGATGFVVVTGHAAEPLEAFLAALSDRFEPPVAWVRTEDWSRPNGHSVLAGAILSGDDYLLAMADHLLDPGIVRRLIDAPRVDGLRLAVDRNLSGPLLDLDDATKVTLGPDGAIQTIGKNLAAFDAVDTGMFRATPALAEAIRAAIAAGAAGSLSDGVQRLADEGRAHTLDVTGLTWLDVDDPQRAELAEAHFAVQG